MLKKPLYGLDDTPGKFCLKIKRILRSEDMKTVNGDEALYYKHEGEKWVWIIITHIDNLSIAGNESFLKE